MGDDLRTAVEADKKQRAEDAMKRIQEALKETNCDVDVFCILTTRGAQFRWQVIAKDPA